ncbi:hypothetical protein NliqN6_2977 [Naganishia liquefaciens]|uniref:Uncharacterized protein n=1 Tax=Naganishia liquefaciens TaxID=104408 RepID=A0A8H3YEH9_9TREE|nr:hypothetical protein NliqN6_2977 [Naganishia liquefaciens]
MATSSHVHDPRLTQLRDLLFAIDNKCFICGDDIKSDPTYDLSHAKSHYRVKPGTDGKKCKACRLRFARKQWKGTSHELADSGDLECKCKISQDADLCRKREEIRRLLKQIYSGKAELDLDPLDTGSSNGQAVADRRESAPNSEAPQNSLPRESAVLTLGQGTDASLPQTDPWIPHASVHTPSLSSCDDASIGPHRSPTSDSSDPHYEAYKLSGLSGYQYF